MAGGQSLMIAGFLLAAGVLFSNPAQAQDFPQKPISLLVLYAAFFFGNGTRHSLEVLAHVP